MLVCLSLLVEFAFALENLMLLQCVVEESLASLGGTSGNEDLGRGDTLLTRGTGDGVLSSDLSSSSLLCLELSWEISSSSFTY